MLFTCTKENLVHALDTVSGITAKQVHLPILANVLIRVTESNVELITTNLELTIKTLLRAKVDKPGEFTVPVKMLSDFVRLIRDEQVQITVEEHELVITAGTSSTKIKGTPSTDFPVIPETVEEHAYTLLSEPFRESLGKVAIAVAKNEIRPELSGVLFDFFSERYGGLILAATDSYRLAEKKMSVAQGDNQLRVIVPAKTVHEMGRLLALGKGLHDSETQVRLWIGENQIGFRFNNVEMSGPLIDGTYPDYTQIIPDNLKTVAQFDNGLMVKTIKAASLFTTTGVNAVSFDFNTSQNSLAVSSTSTQKGEYSSELDVTLSGEENSILLNFRYVLDGLGHIDTDMVEFHVNSPDSPCLFKPHGSDEYVYIVMPIRQ